MKYLIKFSYDGSCFNGFQRQKGLKTVQGVIESALSSLNDRVVSICGSGRTDKGVHARNQYAHFDLDKKVKLYNLKKYLNKSFDGEIFVKEVFCVSDSFHARYDVISKTYSYYINMGEYNPINRNYVLQYGRNLNIYLMCEVSKLFLGEHDFRFVCYGEKLNCVREIYSIDISVIDDIVKITFVGNGFLRKMVRNIVSLLIKVGENKLSFDDVNSIICDNKKNYNIKCVSSCGLYLDDVSYGVDFDE